MKVRMILLVLLSLLLVSLVPAAGAQEMTCYGLSDADCQLLMGAEANSVNMQAFNMTFSLDFNMDASALAAMDPTMGATAVSLTAKGTGAIAYDAMAADPMSGLSLQMDIQLEMTDPSSGEQSVAVSFVIVDGIIYIQDPASGQWIGMELETVMAQAGIPFDLSMLADPSMLSGGMGDMGMGDFDASAFVTQERLADEDMMGQTVYPFMTSVDLVAMLTSPDFQAVMQTAAQAAGGTGAGGDQTAMLMSMLPMLPMLLQESSATIDVTQWVGADDMFIHKMALNIDASIDLNSLMALSGQTDAPKMDPITLVMNFWVELSDINGMIEITAPEGATMMSGM